MMWREGTGNKCALLILPDLRVKFTKYSVLILSIAVIGEYKFYYLPEVDWRSSLGLFALGCELGWMLACGWNLQAGAKRVEFGWRIFSARMGPWFFLLISFGVVGGIAGPRGSETGLSWPN
jgi:hypothetical protein